MPRSRNTRLTPVQRSILWTIEEAGAETLGTVWITVRGAHDSMTEDRLRIEFVDGLLGLSRLGYLRLVCGVSGAEGATVDLPDEALERLWVVPVRDMGDGIEVEMTSAGYEALGRPGGRQRPASRGAS